MGSAGRSQRTGGGQKGRKVNKQVVRKGFRARHIDQVWEDVRKDVGAVHGYVHGGEAVGPLGTTDRAALDDDLPAGGKHYCVPCARYFASDAALEGHARTKPHRRRVKALAGDKPHGQADADWAGGMGPPDNGPRLGMQLDR